MRCACALPGSTAYPSGPTRVSFRSRTIKLLYYHSSLLDQTNDTGRRSCWSAASAHCELSVKLPNSHTIFTLIAAPGGALPTRKSHMVDEVMDKPPEMLDANQAQHPSGPRSGRISNRYNLKMRLAADSLQVHRDVIYRTTVSGSIEWGPKTLRRPAPGSGPCRREDHSARDDDDAHPVIARSARRSNPEGKRTQRPEIASPRVRPARRNDNPTAAVRARLGRSILLVDSFAETGGQQAVSGCCAALRASPA